MVDVEAASIENVDNGLFFHLVNWLHGSDYILNRSHGSISCMDPHVCA